MIHKQLTTYFKVKYGYILIGYYKSHGVGIKPVARKLYQGGKAPQNIKI